MNKNFLLILAISFSNSLFAQVIFPEINSWEKNEITTYDEETLWEYINGAADYYLNYGFMQLEVLEYKQSEEVYIKAEVYSHSSNLNGFGIYAYERTDDAEFITIGSEGYIIHSTLNFFKGPYYVKVYSHNSENATIEAIKTIGNKLSDQLRCDNPMPAELNFLPANRLANSEKYLPKNFLGYSFLPNTILASYKQKGNVLDFFYSTYKTEGEALEALNSYFSMLKMDSTPIANEVFTIDDPFNGLVYCKVTKEKIVGIINCSDQAIALSFLDQF